MTSNKHQQPFPVVIMGATGGIGKVLVRQLEEALPQQILCLAARTLDDLTKTFPQHFIQAIDACDADSVDEFFNYIASTHGGIQGVVHLAGSILLKPAHITKPAEVDSVLKTNLISSFNVVRSATKLMLRQGGGQIVLMSSAAAQVGLPNHEAISAAKAGVIGLVRSAAATYASKNICINGVAPGLVETPLSSKILANLSSRKASEAMHPLGRIIQPKDVADTIVWLLTSTNITGQIINVDGGLSTLKT